MTKPNNLPGSGIILIVEDNKTTQNILLQMAALIGLAAETADNGLEALEKSSVKKYDVIIMDNEMPELNGYETTKRIRGNEGLNKETPIISVTANLTDKSHKKYLEAGMSGFLTKPFNILDLQRSVSHWVNSKPTKDFDAESSSNFDAAQKLQMNADLQRLERLAGRNPEGFRRFVETFLRDTSNGLSDLAKAVSANDFEQAYRCAHGCAGASSFCGFTHLTELLKKIETATTEKNPSQANKLYNEVCLEFEKVKNLLAMIR